MTGSDTQNERIAATDREQADEQASSQAPKASAGRRNEQAHAEQVAAAAEAAERTKAAQATELEQEARRAEARAGTIDPEENR